MYAVTSGGYIIACDGRSEKTWMITCATVASEQGELRGIALLPEIGYCLLSLKRPSDRALSGLDPLGQLFN